MVVLSHDHSRESTTVGHSNSPPGELVESPLQSPMVGEEERPTFVSAQTTAVTDELVRTAQPRRSTRLSEIRRRTQEMMTPSKPIGEEPTVLASIKAFLLCSSASCSIANARPCLMNSAAARTEYFTCLYTCFCASFFAYRLLPATHSSFSGPLILPFLTPLVPETP